MQKAEKAEEAEDLRVRRTRKQLQQAFMELTVEKGFAALTVRDITERAMVNRSTFYRHYLDKYDLLEKYMDEVFELFNIPYKEPIVAEHPGPDEAPVEVVPVGLLNLLKHVRQFADFYRVMLGPKGDPLFTQRFRQNSEKRYRYLISVYDSDAATDPHAPPLELRLSYASYAGVGAIEWWLENGQPCTAEQLAIWLGRFSRSVRGADA
jgi:AcrR family transcriptional regulator